MLAPAPGLALLPRRPGAPPRTCARRWAPRCARPSPAMRPDVVLAVRRRRGAWPARPWTTPTGSACAAWWCAPLRSRSGSASTGAPRWPPGPTGCWSRRAGSPRTCRPRRGGRGVAARRRHRRLHPDAARRAGCTTRGPARARPAARWSSSATSAACTAATASAAWRRWPRCPASARWSIGDGPQRGWLAAPAARCPVHRRAADRRPGHRAGLPRPAGPPRRAGDLLPRPARAAAAAGSPSWRRAPGGARDVVRHLETGLLHDPATPARWCAPSPRWPPTGTAP